MAQLTLHELFQQDPLKYTKQDLGQIVTEIRKMRSTFQNTGTPAKAGKPAAKPDPKFGKIEL